MRELKFRIPISRPGHRMKSKKDYDRQVGKEVEDSCSKCLHYDCEGCDYYIIEEGSLE